MCDYEYTGAASKTWHYLTASLTFQYSQLSLLGLLLYYLMLISFSAQSENLTAGECALVGFTFMFTSSYLPTFVFVPVRQVFVSCNFCGKSISYSCSAMPHQGRGFSQYGVSGSPTKSKVTSCPGCRKPLPRCALCLMNMGTPVSNCPGKLACLEYVDRCSADVSSNRQAFWSLSVHNT